MGQPLFVMVLALLGASISAYGTTIYAFNVWARREDERPRLASWVAWAASNLMFAWLSTDATALFCFFAALLNAMVIAACLWRRHWRYEKMDGFCLALVVTCLAAVASSAEPLIVVLLGIAANLVATIPTFLNAWQGHERVPLFAANILANGIGMLTAAGNLAIVTIAGPAVAVFGNMLLVILVVIAGRMERGKAASVPAPPKLLVPASA